jgi:hypothetical protein
MAATMAGATQYRPPPARAIKAGSGQHEEHRDGHTRPDTNQQPTRPRSQFSPVGRPVDPEQPTSCDHTRDKKVEAQRRGRRVLNYDISSLPVADPAA